MRFELDEDRALLRRSTRELLEKEAPLALSRELIEGSAEGYSKPLYARLAALGYTGLLLPESQGGMGAVALAAVLVEMGRVAFPGPYLDQVLAARVLAGCDGADARSWLARATSGEALVVRAPRDLASGGAAVPPRWSAERVRGTLGFVPFGAQADALLVELDEGLALVPRPDAGWGAVALRTLDPAQRFAEVELDAPALRLAQPVRQAAQLAEADRLGALGASALLLGLMERALELTLDYTRERRAFGAPIASFQALQHRCADMLLQTEGTRSAVFRAAWATDCEPEAAPFLTAVAKAWAGPAARFVCGEALQLHGGVGFTWEVDVHLLLKRAKTLEQLHGATRDQLEAALQARGL